MKKYEELKKAVKDMRYYQTLYFQTKEPRLLVYAKKAEKEVDYLISEKLF